MFKLLFGVQLNDEMFFDRNINFLTSRVTVNFAAEIFSVLNQPCRNGFAGKSFSHAFEIFFGTAAFHNGNNVACFYQSGRNIKAFAVNGDMAVSYNLTSLTAGVCKTKTEYNVVNSSFQKDEQVFTGDAFHFFSSVVVAAELFFQQAINKFCFLLFS